jgi:hypothetical protein
MNRSVMLIDEFMQKYDMMEHHELTVHAPAQRVYDTMRTADMFDSPITRGLFFLRALPAGRSAPKVLSQPFEVTIDTLLEGGFVLLGEDPPHELLIGAVIPFGAAFSETSRPSDAAGFRDFDTPGFVKTVMNLFLTQQPDGTTRLATEPRAFCLDGGSRRRFRLYWFFIGPFSALIRRLMLRAMKKNAEMA